MFKPLSPFLIARAFIERSEPSDQMTPMKVLKLAYITHGWHLAFTNGAPLITDDVEAWKYGPVIPSLYYGIKSYRKDPIPVQDALRFAEPLDQVGRQDLKPLIDRVWHVYRKFSGLQLSDLTHRPGTPWHQVWEVEGGSAKHGAVIPNPLIQQHYQSKRRPA